MATLRYLIRLDDACPTMHRARWEQVEEVLDCHNIKPIVAVIPNNKDKTFMIDAPDPLFWNACGSVQRWQKKGWAIALHGYNHVLLPTEKYGIVPFHKNSEFVGLPLEEQKKKISDGNKVLLCHGITPEVWIAPAHSFDENTLIALRDCTEIKVISDGLALDVYFDRGFYWIPQQIGKFRKFPFGLWTLCLHPNTMTSEEVNEFDTRLEQFRDHFISYSELQLLKRSRSMVDKFFQYTHNAVRRVKKLKCR